jgi:hypothetical protein
MALVGPILIARQQGLAELGPGAAATVPGRLGRAEQQVQVVVATATDAPRRLVWALVMQAMRSSVPARPAAPIRLPEQACHDWGVSPMQL